MKIWSLMAMLLVGCSVAATEPPPPKPVDMHPAAPAGCTVDLNACPDNVTVEPFASCSSWYMCPGPDPMKPAPRCTRVSNCACYSKAAAAGEWFTFPAECEGT